MKSLDSPIEWYALRHSVMQERMAQVREIEREGLQEDEAGSCARCGAKSLREGHRASPSSRSAFEV